MGTDPAPRAMDLFASRIQLRADGSVDVGRRSGFDDPGLWTLAALHADSDRAVHSHVWERHRAGHEILCLISGQVSVYLRDYADGQQPIVELTPGTCYIVPAGRWHRLTVSQPGDLLAITPRTSTQRERLTDVTDPS